MPKPPNLPNQIALHAKQFPNQIAVKFLRADSEAEILTYALLQQRIDSVAAAVQQRVGVGERALLLYPQGLGFVAAFLGCLQAGVIAVPAYKPGFGPFHAQTTESLVAPVPGIDVVMPSSAGDASDLLNFAFESTRPRIYVLDATRIRADLTMPATDDNSQRAVEMLTKVGQGTGISKEHK